MKIIGTSLILVILWMGLVPEAGATHNRAGEIIVEQINDCVGNMVRCTVITYTKTSSVAADRDTVEVCWGDGFCEMVPRANGVGQPPQGQPGPNDVKFNYYIATHTYDGTGSYTVSMTDPNRNGGILNVNPPASDNVQFHLQTTFTLFNAQFQGCNSTPRLLQPPIDYACVGERFVHNPNAYDPDGDSLSYELIVPLQSVDTQVPNYTFPQNIQGNGCCLTLSQLDGTLIWDAPQVPGEFNIAMIIISWRDGVATDTTVRDMQILVFDCDQNHAPVIEAPDEICVIAGEEVLFQVKATDPDMGDKIKLSALGAPFIISVSPAEDEDTWRPTGSPSATYGNQPVIKTFRWRTDCAHISDLPYTVVFKAEDDYFLQSVPGSTGLATLKPVRIKVVGPPPADVQADAASDLIAVSWEKPYACEAAPDDYFFGFSVWRREGNNPFPVDTCTPGLDGKGYAWLANTKADVNGRYQYEDFEVERGKTYCYRILARFARRTNAGQPYNFVESLPSDEICVQLNMDVPLVTHVSVLETGPDNGRMDVRWTKPRAEDLDTLLNPGPYRLVLARAAGIGNTGGQPVVTFESDTYWQFDNLSYVDEPPAVLNTLASPYTYQLFFYVNGESEPIGDSPPASSVFLNLAPTDNRMDLSWDYEVPWVNTDFVVYRRNEDTGLWDSIGITPLTTFQDTGLLNGREYCYRILASGSYGIEGLPSPLLNWSQEACGSPLDNVAPCPPLLRVTNICDENVNCQEGADFRNRLGWTNPMSLCTETDDVVGYNIYFSPLEGEPLVWLASLDDSGDTTFLHQPDRGLAGCYAVTALDTFQNESLYSNIVCKDNCPNYELPNAFTPNGDGANEVFTPYPYCFIDRVDMKIFNRWGELVFETTDPSIQWRGENMRGQALAAGTYYYTCEVFEQRVTGSVPSAVLRKGYIDLIR